VALGGPARRTPTPRRAALAWPRRAPAAIVTATEDAMNGLIYLIGLAVVIYFLLTFFGML
jgi:hypothetical protein